MWDASLRTDWHWFSILSKFIIILSLHTIAKMLTKPSSHLQKAKGVEQHSHIIVSKIRHDVSEHQTDSNTYFQPFMDT